MISNRRKRMQTRRRVIRIAIIVGAVALLAALFFGGRFLFQRLNQEKPANTVPDNMVETFEKPEDQVSEETPTPVPPTGKDDAIVYPANPGAQAPDGGTGGAVTPSPVPDPTTGDAVGAVFGNVAFAEESFEEPLGEEENLEETEGEGETGELRLSGLVIGIDPGHQGKGNNEKEPIAPGSSETKAKVASGTSGTATKIPEHETNLEISLKLRDALVALGAEVHMTRETADVDISNVERAVMMNELGVDLVLRLHCNGSTNTDKNGIGLYVRKTGEGAEECLNAAEALMPEMIAATDAREDGIFRNDTYTGLNWSTVPCILVEMGFMTNPREDKLLNSDEYQDKLISGMVEGIAQYLLDEDDQD